MDVSMQKIAGEAECLTMLALLTRRLWPHACRYTPTCCPQLPAHSRAWDVRVIVLSMGKDNWHPLCYKKKRVSKACALQGIEVTKLLLRTAVGNSVVFLTHRKH